MNSATEQSTTPRSISHGAGWTTLIIGGPSGVGKSEVALRLQRRVPGASLILGDSIHYALQRVITTEQQPLLHYWNTHPEARLWPAERILELHKSVAHITLPAYVAIVEEYDANQSLCILEGDYLLPEMTTHLCASTHTRTRSVYLYEQADQITCNFAARDGADVDWRGRAQVSSLFGQWLQAECAHPHYQAVALPARPWDTLVDRILAIAGKTHEIPANH